MTDYPYGVNELAEETGLAPHIVRTKLRGLNVDKHDGRYQWSKKSEFNDVLKQIKSESKDAAPAKSKAKAEKDDGAKTSKKSKKAKEDKNAGAAPENKAKKKGKKKAS